MFTRQVAADHLYGVTIETVAYPAKKSAAIAKLGKPITARVVFQHGLFEEGLVDEYQALLAELRRDGRTRIMGLPVDAVSVAKYTPDTYAAHVKRLLDTFGTSVDIWEIGNEVNSDLVSKGKKEAVMAMVASAQDVVAAHRQKRPVAVTFYIACNEMLEKKPIDSKHMLRYVDELLRRYPKLKKIDYAFISYYDHNCAGYPKPVWTSVFPRLTRKFSGAAVGFGENGVKDDPNCNLRPAKMLEYYQMRPGGRYVGGNFWWYFERDVLGAPPYKNPPCNGTLLDALREAMNGSR